MQDTTRNKSSEAPDERKDLVINKNETRGETMDQINQVVPMCKNCANNSANPTTGAVHCYWKERKGLDVDNTCKHFHKGNANLYVPVNDYFILTIDKDQIFIAPAYVFSFLDHHMRKKVESERNKWLYDAGNDLLINDSYHMNLETLLECHPKVIAHRFITETMACKYPEMAAARDMLDENMRTKVRLLKEAVLLLENQL